METVVFFLIITSFFCAINCRISRSSEAQCLSYYNNEENFDLDTLSGQMYAVYYWPPNQRTRNACEVQTFKKLDTYEIETARNGCSNLSLPSEEPVIRATYKNSTGKIVNVLYYGSDSVKNFYRSCDKDVAKYIFTRVNEDYILGINCSSEGRSVLLSKLLGSLSTVKRIVDGIDIMTGREGSPDCVLEH
ncbi:uncharacterized protein LOC119631074 [Bombyx mori]|uniref:Uncharacterized protein n=1 Tax=Bombyx mori TaxID=7091 RepID=A0A8R2M8Z2_BOMMO|nr:uncharacterized protein LOC119629748 [Bombyx mori]XP_037877517.1 uncharacterized protein LOC119631074 [Bombyx mori]